MSQAAAPVPAALSGSSRLHHRLVQSSSLAVHPEQPLTVDRVLRRLEVLRKQLSVRWCGTEGAFAGYDQLEIGNFAGIVDGTVELHAILVEADHASHVVELGATRPTTDEKQESHSASDVLVHGVGRALQTRRSE